MSETADEARLLLQAAVSLLRLGHLDGYVQARLEQHGYSHNDMHAAAFRLIGAAVAEAESREPAHA